MTTNPYAPPTAIVEDVVAPVVGNSTPAFYAVSVFKLCLLSFCTLGFYQIYWFYKQWKQIKERERSDIYPAARALFGLFYCYACFACVRDFNLPSVPKSRLPAGALATGWIVTALLSRVPGHIALVTVFAFVFLIPVQMQANQINAAVSPGHDRNASLTGWNWLVIVLGLAFAALVIAGLLLSPQ